MKKLSSDLRKVFQRSDYLWTVFGLFGIPYKNGCDIIPMFSETGDGKSKIKEEKYV